MKTTLVSALTTTALLLQPAIAEVCKAPSLADNLHVTIPCVGVQANQYSVILKLNPIKTEQLFWKLDMANVRPANCQWEATVCATTDEHLNVTIPSILINRQKNTAVLKRYVNQDDQPGFYWKYQTHYTHDPQADGKEGFSDNHGTLAPADKPAPVVGNGKKLLAIYMVGSDLESNGNAGTDDFNELIQGYNALSDKSKVDIIVAFGGANKDGWKGMKYANMDQILKDAQDQVFGNAGDYQYQEDRAHMGDKSTLKHFLDYLKTNYTGHQQQFMVFWDHGESYGGFGNDENHNGDGLSLEEINGALQDSGIEKFDLIGFDACLMGSVEVAQSVKQHANYLLGSEELEPGHGWFWDDVIKAYAQNSTITETGKAIIESFVKREGDSERTLSLVDLAQFEALVNQLNGFADNYAAQLRNKEPVYIKALNHAVSNVQNYGDENRTGDIISVDLQHFAMLAKKKLNTAEFDGLIGQLGKTVVYSKDDGSKPNSYGIAIHPFQKVPHDEKHVLNKKLLALHEAVKAHIKADTQPPIVAEQTDNVSSTTVGDLNSQIRPALANEAQFNQLPQNQQQRVVDLAKQLIESMLSEGLDFQTALSEYIQWYLTEDIAWVTKNTRAATSARSRNGSPDLPSFLRGERIAFTALEPTDRRSLREIPEAVGTLATFQDENLIGVTALFGHILTVEDYDENGVIKPIRTFSTVAKLEANATTVPGQYFVPSWNKKWYTIKYDPAEPTQWMPLSFIERQRRDDGKTYTIYSAEIDYVEAGKDYSKGTHPTDSEDSGFDFAVMKLTVNDQNQVIDYKIVTYKLVYTSPYDQDSEVLFDRVSKQIQPGDQIRFFTRQIDLASGESSRWAHTNKEADIWTDIGPFITFTQTPEFRVEVLDFVDQNGRDLEYYYTMRAEDIAGHVTMTEPVKTDN